MLHRLPFPLHRLCPLPLHLRLNSAPPRRPTTSRAFFGYPPRSLRVRTMVEESKASLPHVERTKDEPRGDSLHTLKISKITQLNPFIRLFQLTPISSISSSASQPPLSFKPGQWLDVHVPGIQRAGGFTITSSPSLLFPRAANFSSSPSSTSTINELSTTENSISSPHKINGENYYRDENIRSGYLELAIMDSPSSPPAAYLWQPERQITGTEVDVRVGGSFIWPPPNLSLSSSLDASINPRDNKEQLVAPAEQANQLPHLNHAIFIAGGVGINPLMSMISSLVEEKQKRKGKLGFKMTFLYSTRLPQHQNENDRKARLSSILFLDRLRDAFDILGDEGALKTFFTDHVDSDNAQKKISKNAQERSTEEERLRAEMNGVKVHRRRIEKKDLLDALGPVKSRHGTVCYICGVPSMTDEFVEVARGAEGMSEGNVLCEKWW